MTPDSPTGRWLDELTDAEVAEQLAAEQRDNGTIGVSGWWPDRATMARDLLAHRRPWLLPDYPAIAPYRPELDRLVAPRLTRALALPGKLRGRLRAVWAAWRHPGGDW